MRLCFTFMGEDPECILMIPEIKNDRVVCQEFAKRDIEMVDRGDGNYVIREKGTDHK